MSLILGPNGKLLLSPAGKLATHTDCCCGDDTPLCDPENVTQMDINIAGFLAVPSCTQYGAPPRCDDFPLLHTDYFIEDLNGPYSTTNISLNPPSYVIATFNIGVLNSYPTAGILVGRREHFRLSDDGLLTCTELGTISITETYAYKIEVLVTCCSTAYEDEVPLPDPYICLNPINCDIDTSGGYFVHLQTFTASPPYTTWTHTTTGSVLQGRLGMSSSLQAITSFNPVTGGVTFPDVVACEELTGRFSESSFTASGTDLELEIANYCTSPGNDHPAIDNPSIDIELFS